MMDLEKKSIFDTAYWAILGSIAFLHLVGVLNFLDPDKFLAFWGIRYDSKSNFIFIVGLGIIVCVYLLFLIGKMLYDFWVRVVKRKYFFKQGWKIEGGFKKKIDDYSYNVWIRSYATFFAVIISFILGKLFVFVGIFNCERQIIEHLGYTEYCPTQRQTIFLLIFILSMVYIFVPVSILEKFKNVWKSKK